jgi:predicted house-cleaning noncanonical NTP pyrophosphatase (MazG superfamily)
MNKQITDALLAVIEETAEYLVTKDLNLSEYKKIVNKHLNSIRETVNEPSSEN